MAARLRASRSTRPGLGLLNLDVVDPRDWGVKWDGVTDDTAAWTTFFAALGATPAIILCAYGTSICGPDVIQLDARQALVGQNGATILKLRTGSTSSRLVSTKNIATLAGSANTGGPREFGIYGVRLEGNSAGVSIRPLGTKPPTPTLATVAGTLPAGDYQYRITAKNALGETIASDWATRNLASAGGVSVTWTAVSGATGYNVYGRQWAQGGSGFAFLGTTAGLTYSDSSLTAVGAEMLGRHDGTAGALLHLYGYNYVLDDVTIHDAPGMGHLFEWARGADPAVGIDMEAQIGHLRVSECYSNGGAFYGPHDSTANTLFYASNAKQAVDNIDNFVLGDGPLVVDKIHTWGQSRYSQAIYGQIYVAHGEAEGGLTGDLFVFNTEVVWSGLVYYPGNATAKGLIIGDATYSPTNIRISAKAMQFGRNLGSYTSNGAAFDLKYLGHSSIVSLHSDQTAGTLLIPPDNPGSSIVEVVNEVLPVINIPRLIRQRTIVDVAATEPNSAFRVSVAGTGRWEVGTGGNVGHGIGVNTSFRYLMQLATAAERGIAVVGAAAQTGNPFEVQSSAFVIQGGLGPDGRHFVGTANTAQIFHGGAASPEASVTAGPGSVYAQSDGTVWRKMAGTGNVGWMVLTSSMGSGMHRGVRPGTGTGIQTVGVGWNAAVGTISHPTPATGNARTKAARFVTTSAATAAALSTNRSAELRLSGEVGFSFLMTFGIETSVAGMRKFFGLRSSVAAPTNVDPATLTNQLGVGAATDTGNWQLYAAGASAQAAIDLGASFAQSTTSMWELRLLWIPGDSVVYYRVRDLGSGASISNTLTGVQLPALTTYLAFYNWSTNNATAAACAHCIGRIDVDSQY